MYPPVLVVMISLCTDPRVVTLIQVVGLLTVYRLLPYGL